MSTRRKIQNRQRTKNVLRRIKRRNDKIHKLLRSRKNKATRKYSQQKSKMIGGYGGPDYVAFDIYFYPEDIAGEYKKKRVEVMSKSKYIVDGKNPRYEQHKYLFAGSRSSPRFCVPYYDEYLFAVIVYDSNNLYVFDNPNFNLGEADMKNKNLRLLIQKLFGIDFSKDPKAYTSVSKIIFDKTGKGIVLKPNEGIHIGGTHKLQQTNIEKARQGKDPYEDMKNFTPVESATKLLTDFKTLRESPDSKKLKIPESLKSQLEEIITGLNFDNFKCKVEPTTTNQIFPVFNPWNAWNSQISNNYYKVQLSKRSSTVNEYCTTQNKDTGNQPIADEEYDISDHTFGNDDGTND